MGQLDFSLQVRNTVIQVVYGDVTRLEADALISSDDVHLSAASGLSKAIREAAGVRLGYDIRKFALPRPLGSVLVTSAGQLPAKYIFHTMTISFDEPPQFDLLIPKLIRRVLEISAQLEVTSIAMPMINAGLVSVPPEVILRVIVEGSSCFLASNPSPVQRILLAVYDDEAKDHEAAESKLNERLTEIRNEMARWQEACKPINERLRLLQPLCELTTDDQELQQVVSSRIATAESSLQELFNCAQGANEAPSLYGAKARTGGALRNRAEYLKAKSRLDTLLENLQRNLDHLNKLQSIQETRAQQLELKAALKGIDTPVDVQTELEDLQANIANRARDIERLQDQQQEASTQRDTLVARWERTGIRRKDTTSNSSDEQETPADSDSGNTAPTPSE